MKFTLKGYVLKNLDKEGYYIIFEDKDFKLSLEKSELKKLNSFSRKEKNLFGKRLEVKKKRVTLPSSSPKRRVK